MPEKRKGTKHVDDRKTFLLVIFPEDRANIMYLKAQLHSSACAAVRYAISEMAKQMRKA
jgi:hypothetical protein